jgi:DNA-binding NtrC family response regulator
LFGESYWRMVAALLLLRSSLMARYSGSISPAEVHTRNESVVLLVDDDESFRSALAENLRDDGFEVIEYAAAPEVPPLAAFQDVRVVVTDYDMPGTDGLSFADTFHAVHPTVPIIMVTGACTTQLEAEATARGFMSLMRKPLEYDRLHSLLHRLPH